MTLFYLLTVLGLSLLQLSTAQNPFSKAVSSTPNDIVVALEVKIPGIGKDGNQFPIHKTRSVTLNLIDTQNQPVTQGTGFLTFDGDTFSGTIHLGAIPTGVYYIKLAMDLALQKLIIPPFQPLSDQQINQTPVAKVNIGDYTGDNALNIDDYNFFMKCFYQAAECVNHAKLDLNDDGKVDLYDYNIILQNFLSEAGQ